MNLKQLGMIFAAAVMMVACGGKKAAVGTAALPEGEWKIVAVNGETVESKMEKKPFLAFDQQEKRVHGNSGCNIVNGGYTQDKPGQLKFGMLMSTMMACPEMDLERKILTAMEQVESYVRVKDTYELRDKDGKAVLILKK